MRQFRSLLGWFSVTVILLLAAMQVMARFESPAAPFQFLSLYARVLRLSVDGYVDPVDKADLEKHAADGLIAGLDGESGLIETDWKPEIRHAHGLLLRTSGSYAVVIAVQPDAPAEKAGLVAGDVLRRIDGQSVYGMSLPKIRMLLDKAVAGGKKLELLTGRDEEKKAIVITGKTGPWGGLKLVEEKDGPARIELYNTGMDEKNGVLAAIRGLRTASPARKIILDLRRNPGDDFAGGAALAQALGGKPFVLAGNPDSPYGGEEKFPAAQPVAAVDALITDGSTARAAEALAAALKAAGIPVYGRTTAGLATTQSRVALPDGRWIWMTTRAVFMADKSLAGTALAPEGVEPVVKAGPEDEDLVKFTLDQLQPSAQAIPAAPSAPSAPSA